jgi:hypothetical protein
VRKRTPADLDRRIGVHDRQQFELKLEYQPRPGDKESRYLVEMYVCVPANLNVGPETTPTSSWYADIHNYVRLKTPIMSWPELETMPSSPLVRATEELASVRSGGDPSTFVYECKMYASVFRHALRDLAEEVEREHDLERVAEIVHAAVDGAQRVEAAFRKLAPETEKVGESARAAYRLADEYTSISVEQMMRRIIVAVDRRTHGQEGDDLKVRCLQMILDEESYRRERQYPAILDPRSDNEPYIYRAGLLKKYCSSALFLQIHRRKTRKTWQEIFFAIAAGIAMVFASLVALWGQKHFAPGSTRILLLVIVGYMFKDRIKEAGRAFFSRYLEKRFFDRKVVIDDPAGGTLGVLREKIDYHRPEDLPTDVREIRRRGVDRTALVAEEELPQTCLHYKKEIVLDSRKLLGRRSGGGLTDIVRFHIARLLHDMDEPDQEIEYVDAETRRLDPIRAAKVYHVDVVFRFVSKNEPPATTLMRLILDRRGIKRIERD